MPDKRVNELEYVPPTCVKVLEASMRHEYRGTVRVDAVALRELLERLK